MSEDGVSHRDYESLDALLPTMKAQQASTTSPSVQMVVRRPSTDEREIVSSPARLSVQEGLVGDGWTAPGDDFEDQLTLMSSLVLDAITGGDRSRWPLAGDQLIVDLELGGLQPGQRIKAGSATIEITARPHIGCAKFIARFGRGAFKWVNCSLGKELKLRGIYAKVVEDGEVSVGDPITLISE